MDPTPHLPLQILRSDPTPSAPNRSDPPGSAIDWLPDFLDLSWVSYGASSLLVISHFPSPLSENETVIGPIFRQVFELSGDPSSAVRAVAWSPVMPSLGEVAAAAENCVWVFSHDSASSKGSFCWSQNAVLVNSAKVEAIGWTGSGDGIIASGIEVVLWKRSGRSWEIAWKFKADQPQSLVSATWSVEGPFATAAYQSKWLIEGLLTKEASKCVLVSQRDGKSEFVKSELQHPLPVSMIQWRPLTGKPLSRDAKHPSRHVLLTSCLDGTVRLWCAVDDGRARKVAKDINDHKTTRWSFSVAAVIEINQALNGILGIDIYVTWAIESGGLNKASAGPKKLFSATGYEHDQLGNCEWLIGFGPGMLVKFWALHCLDDVSPVRFPRVTLWKTQELQVLEGGRIHRTGLSNYNDRIPLNKVVIFRNCISGPPVVCSLIQLLPCNSLVWSLLHTQSSNNVEDLTLNKPGMENTLSCSAAGLLNLDGHAGRILQVAVHPYSCEVELAVSLDSDGLLLFWFFSTISNYILGRPTLVPTWDICGKLATQSSSSRYTSMRWAPAILNEVAVLLMGHAGGIDCFIVKIHQDEEEIIECHYLCTIPFTGHGPYEDGPNSISTIPLPLTCHKTLRCSKFILLGIWMNGFQALSWEITLHTFDLSGSYCDCDFETGNGPESMWGFEGTFTNIRYCLKVNACSSQIPDPYIHDEVTSFAVVCQGSLMRIEKNLGPTIDQCSSCPAYLMATGCSDGTLKLWRSRIDKLSTPNIPWELVGMFVAHKGPISTVCLSECGRKIATICKDFSSNTVGTLQIWDPIHLAGAGSFMLEDTISFDQELVALNWLPLGNGQLLLGVCTLNQFRVYSLERCGGQTLLNPEKSVKKNMWVCIASTHTFPPICDFFWGPRATAVFVHKSYFCVNSQWLFLVDKKHLANGQSNDIAENCMDSAGGMKEDTSSIFFDCELQQFDKTLLDESRRDCKSGAPFKTDLKKDYLSSSLFVARSQLDCAWGTKLGLWTMLQVVEKLSGSLPVYHPEALFLNIYSGNWKRTYIALRHLNDFLSSDSSSGSKHYPSKSSIFVPQILLSTFLDGIISIESNDKGFQWSGDAGTSSSQLQRDSGQFTYDSYASNNMFSSSSTKYGLVDFVEHLEKLYELAAITNIERMQILAIFDLLNEMTNSNSGSAYESLDEPGRRFWIALRFQQLHFFRKFGRSVSVEELVVDSKLIGWAYHSDCQENLFGSFLPNEPSWQEMRNLGVGFWFTNTAQLRSRMEKLARLQYLKRRDPKDCALLYIALNRIQVLTGLFKISKDEKDKPLVAFLSRNFQEEKNKAAALKNAYVLMGRHQLELAVAFFLLGGDTSSAVSICAKNLGDEQLAVVICRLTEGRGGPLERHLISKSLLPFAIERGDSWLASLLEWELGNYYQSFISMLGFQINSATKMYATLSNSVAFSDPNVGLYCLLLATKNSMRNAVGERNTAILSRWAVFMTATALKRCGLPLEALEYLSSPTTILGDTDLGTVSDIGDFEKLNGILNPSPKNSSNWLSSNVAFRVEFLTRLDLALQYLSTLVREHPSWPDTVVAPSRAISHINECENHEYVKVLGSFHQKLYTALHHLEQKFSVVPFHLISMVLLSLYNRGLWFVGYEILHAYTSQDQDLNKSQIVRSLLYPLMHKQLLKATRETSLLFSRVIAACSITCSKLKSDCLENNVSGESGSSSSNAWGYYFQGLILSLQSLRSALQIISVSSTEDLIMKPLIIIDWIEYYVQFACAWLQTNSKVLFQLMQPLLITFTNGHTPYEVDLMDLKKLLPQIGESVTQNSLTDNVCTGLQGSQGTDVAHLIPEDERWQIIGACLWQHISRLMKHKLGMLSYKLDEGCISGVPGGKHFSSVLCSDNLGPVDNRTEELIGLVSLSLVKLLKTTLGHVSSYHVMRLASHLQHKMDNGLHVMTLVWLEEYNQSQTRGLNQHLNQDILKLETIGEKHGSDILWDICADPKIISESFTQEKIYWSHSLDHKPSKGWNNIYRGVTTVDETEESHNPELTPKSTSASSEAGLPSRSLFRSGHSFLSGWQKDTTATKEVSPFLNPKEIYKRNGELLEALCLNSVNQKQAALASNRKGILFFNWKDDMPERDHSDFIWSEADWPLNGWAGSESTPAPTYVSPGVGLGIKKGTHLGLGGATVGVGSLARSARDLRGGGAFGNQGYPGMRVSGLGWETREDFEEVVDPPPSVENANTRVFSSHPSRPFFLVGSSNTHIYLWEFGKDKATATYGVLPAANVPPPYALASISALQFDHCGHRFATAALDGTVCTWQLEVGGRSNIRPTESSLCFNSHASDVAYVTSSGSIIAVAGYSSSSVNVVIWDTLAPPTTSRASIICHEGGTRSLSVFDNDIGSGSISPLIVTGGKGGDVGLHDFRYIATGRSKRQRHTDKGEQAVKTSSNIDHHPGDGNRFGEQNQNGMLWYIPKAHSGSVTKISIIPNTSLFLTGSKDGDVKLWDAKRAKLVYHWPKLHERHTFLQPSSRGFGGVVQAAVTDIKVVSQGFLTCGGDGTVKLVHLKDHQY